MGVTKYLQNDGVCIDSQCVEETQLVTVGEVVHEDAASVNHFSIASNHTIQESLGRAAQEGTGQALETHERDPG